jgi:pimeloyl-ACP methyl ester carboxylesterase
VTRTTLVILTTVATALVAAACSTADGSATARLESAPRSDADPAAGDIEWGSCTQELAQLAALECGSLEVPLDPAAPDGDTIELAVARAASTGTPEERIGSLVLNPGGPGGSGIEFLANASAEFPEELTDRFDLVSFDPRGVGESTPVRCLDDDEKDAELEGDLSPDTPEEIARAVEDQASFVRSCTERSGDLIRHMSTADVAADLDVLRAALGDEQLTYLGFSYGTSIGATYATLFPERSRALVLDGSVSPSASSEEAALAQALGFERTLASFVEACDADADCALAPDAAAAIDAARAGLERRPVEVRDATGTRTLTADLFDFALATALYDTTLWGTTAEAIASVRDGGASTLLALVDRQTGRQSDGTYDNSSDAQAMVNCADAPDRLDEQEAAAAARRIAEQAPFFGPFVGWATLGCVGWPEPANPLPTPTGEGAPPILVVGTVGDPATPYEWSEEMADSLETGVLVTYEGDGHTAFLRGGECIERIVVDYLVDLVVPDEGTSCPAEDDGIGFGGLADVLVEQFVATGIPEPLARCVVDGIREEVGPERFDELVLSNDVEEFTRLVTAQALRCNAGG